MNAFSQRTNNLTNKDNKLKLKLKTLNNIQIGINNNEKLNNIKQIVENIRKHNINFAKDTRHTLSTIAMLNEVNLPSTTTTTQPHNTTPSNPSSIPSHKRTHSKGRSLTTLKTLKDENSEMRKQIAALQRENTYLKEENHNLKLKLTAYTTTSTTIESSRTTNNNGMYCYNYSVPNLFMSNSNSNHNGNRSYSNKQACSLNSSVCNSNSNVGATSLSKVPLACSRMEKKKRQLLMFNINNNFITTQQPSLTVANVNSNSNNNNHLVYHNYNQHTYNVGDKQRVLSANKKTIHTNNSLNTIERLLDMEVERYLLATALTGIISQKLARKLCVHCRKKRATNAYEKNIFMKVLHKEVNEIYDLLKTTETYYNAVKIDNSYADVAAYYSEDLTRLREYCDSLYKEKLANNEVEQIYNEGTPLPIE